MKALFSLCQELTDGLASSSIFGLFILVHATEDFVGGILYGQLEAHLASLALVSSPRKAASPPTEEQESA